jgi:DNA modification methylase
MNTEKINIKKLKPNPANPRTIRDDKFHKLVQSVKDFPQMLEIRPIVVNDQYEVLGGNMRLRACIEAGMKEVTIIRASELTEDQQRRFIISDNNNFGSWDMDALANEWDAEELQEWGVDLPVFGEGEGGQQEAQEDAYEMPDEIKTDIILGDLFEIGPHRLLCGDSTDRESVERLMGGEKADMVFTDPPYGMNYKGSTFGKDGLSNDGDGEWEAVLSGAIKNILLFSENALCAICFGTSRLDRFFECAKSMKFKRILTIYKPNRMAFPWRGWILTSEVICLFENGEPRYNEDNHCHDVYTFDYSERPDKSVDHPTVKPLSIVFDVIRKGGAGAVLDLFLGSGTTIVAAHQLKRRCFGMELDPKYCQVIIDRILKLDPTLDIKKNGEAYEVPKLNKD